MTWVIPSETPYEIQRRQRGIKVWAVQRALNSLGFALVEDGIFGQKTEDAVLAYQIQTLLPQVGIVGEKTQAMIAADLGKRVEQIVELPLRLLEGVCEGESSKKIAAVNWSVDGGVDCGFMQRRVYEADYGNDAVAERAFDGRYQMLLFARTTKGRHDAFFGQTGARTHEKAWRLAVLNHNYPSLAAKIAAGGVSSLSSYYTTPQSWVVAIGAKFPDGYSVRTPLEWGQHYSLGNPAHGEPGMMVKYTYPL